MEGRVTFAAVMILSILGLPYSEVSGSPRSHHIRKPMIQKQECLLNFGEFDEQQIAYPRTNGVEVVNGREFPFIVHLDLVISPSEIHECSGSILNNFWIVTAANCLAESVVSIVAFVGSNKKRRGKKHYVIHQIIHENYLQTETIDLNDICLLKVDEPMIFIPGIANITLPEPFEEVPLGTEVLALGWGHTDLESDNDLKLKIARKRITTAKLIASQSEIAETHLFAEDVYPDVQFFEDNGGPLVWDGKVIGINSKGLMGEARGVPAVYTKLSHYISWINKKINRKKF